MTPVDKRPPLAADFRPSEDQQEVFVPRVDGQLETMTRLHHKQYFSERDERAHAASLSHERKLDDLLCMSYHDITAGGCPACNGWGCGTCHGTGRKDVWEVEMKLLDLVNSTELRSSR